VIHDHFLIYATGGLAYARLDHTLSDDCVGCGNVGVNLGTLWQSNSGNQVGWTAGGGGEFVHDERWLIRAEALFVDLGSDTNSYILDTPLATANSLGKWTDEFWIGRIGLGYRFDTP
jgi:outer membrane immunogenic protein